MGIPPQSRSVMEPHNQGSLGDTMGGGRKEVGGTRWVHLRVGAMGPMLGLRARPIRGGAGSNVIRRWCGRGLVCVRVPQ